MSVQGSPRFDTLALMELSARFFPQLELKGKAAYSDSKTGMSHGSTFAQQWSKTTLEALEHLRSCMEQDLAARDFTDRQETAQQLPLTGLREFLSGPDAAQL